MTKTEILNWLLETNPTTLDTLWEKADRVRQENVGDAVHLRGLIEISNYCRRNCGYCGLNRSNHPLERYRMTRDEILTCASQAAQFGYGTVVMQAGEDPGITGEWMADLIRELKTQSNLAITLSLGERARGELRRWRAAGADRYLLRFETSNAALYDQIHPPLGKIPSDRLDLLKYLRDLGYETGSGVMIGIPGQTYSDLADDILLFRELDLDMIGVGPFIAHPSTPIGQSASNGYGDFSVQVPATEAMTYKVLALARLACPRSNIPSTTALATLNTLSGREQGLSRGANVVMPNLTPPHYRQKYEIYPGKACLSETALQCNQCLENRILSMGRSIGTGPGDSPNRRLRRSPVE